MFGFTACMDRLCEGFKPVENIICNRRLRRVASCPQNNLKIFSVEFQSTIPVINSFSFIQDPLYSHLHGIIIPCAPTCPNLSTPTSRRGSQYILCGSYVCVCVLTDMYVQSLRCLYTYMFKQNRKICMCVYIRINTSECKAQPLLRATT